MAMLAVARSLCGRLRLPEAVRSSWGWHTHVDPQHAGTDPQVVRDAMLELLRGHAGRRASQLAAAIRKCEDVQSLWHLRPSLLQAIAAERGEGEARRHLAALDRLLRAGWPEAPVSRASPFG